MEGGLAACDGLNRETDVRFQSGDLVSVRDRESGRLVVYFLLSVTCSQCETRVRSGADRRRGLRGVRCGLRVRGYRCSLRDVQAHRLADPDSARTGDIPCQTYKEFTVFSLQAMLCALRGASMIPGKEEELERATEEFMSASQDQKVYYLAR